MQQVTAIIHPHRLRPVIDALHTLSHFPGVTVTRVNGQGRGRGKGGKFLPDAENIFFHERCRLEIICNDSAGEEITRLIRDAAHTGNPGDGIVTVTQLALVLRIRTGELQADAT